MALATFLSIQLETDPELEWEMSSCYFSYEETPELLDAVQTFVMGNALVEPREYNMEFAKIKKAVFAHPDCPPRSYSRRSPVPL